MPEVFFCSSLFIELEISMTSFLSKNFLKVALLYLFSLRTNSLHKSHMAQFLVFLVHVM